MIEEGVYEFLEVIEISDEVARTATMNVIYYMSQDESQFEKRMANTDEDKIEGAARVSEARGILFSEEGIILSLQIV
jgi:hypothetical protein